MKFVLAPDKFKGSLSGIEFCNAVESGILKVFPEAVIVKKPLADGGDGTIDVIQYYLNARIVKVKVHNPLFEIIEARYLFSEHKKTAFIEMSEASGYKLMVGREYNCTNTTTLGTGELISDALKRGAKSIVLGIGGSATNDAGMGIAQALGYKFLDKNGKQLSPIGKNLMKVTKVLSSNKHTQLKDTRMKVACDVRNPFYGPQGAAFVYAPQKGASNQDIVLLDTGLRSFSKILLNKFGIDVQKISGTGAAGGVGGGALVFLNATLLSGIELVKEIADFDASIKNANWIITGEGKLDNQTLSGKTISGVIKSAQKKGIPVAALCGVVDLSIEQQQELGISYATSILKNFQTIDIAIKNSYENLLLCSFNFASALKKSINGN